MDFRIVGPITDKQTIASGMSVRSRRQLMLKYGGSGWRKMKGIAWVETHSGRSGRAEIHWYAAHGVGSKDFKIKRFFD
jgi:hypothetical protein